MRSVSMRRGPDWNCVLALQRAMRGDYFANAAVTSFTASSLAHSAGPASVPISQPAGSTRMVVGMPIARPDHLEFLEHLGARIGVVGEAVDAGLLQPGLRLVEIAGVDVDRDHLERRPAELGLERVERRHLLAARHAPGGPQVEQHGAAAPVGQPVLLPGRHRAGRGRAAAAAARPPPRRRPRRAPAAQCAARCPPPGAQAGSPALRWKAAIPYTAPASAPPTTSPSDAATIRRRFRTFACGSETWGWAGWSFIRSTSLLTGLSRAVMSNKMWGGRFGASPDADHGGDQRLDRFRPASFPPGHRREQGPCRDAGQAGHHPGRRCAQDRSRSRHDPVRDRGRQVRVQARARRHSHERREPARRADRAGGRAAAHRALAQRSGGDRLPAVGARRPSTRSTRRSPAISARWPRRRWSTPRP